MPMLAALSATAKIVTEDDRLELQTVLAVASRKSTTICSAK
jgi:hypothetical protein